METTGLIGDILKQVAKAADQLEMDLDDHPFDKAIHNLVGPVRNYGKFVTINLKIVIPQCALLLPRDM